MRSPPCVPIVLKSVHLWHYASCSVEAVTSGPMFRGGIRIREAWIIGEALGVGGARVVSATNSRVSRFSLGADFCLGMG